MLLDWNFKEKSCFSI